MGIAFLCTSLASLSLYGVLSSRSKGIIFSSFIMLIFGILDDWRELSVGANWRCKFSPPPYWFFPAFARTSYS
jgi:hypothetical protein